MSRIIHQFTPHVLLQNLSVLPSCSRYLVGYSGGADSTALLLALHQCIEQISCKPEAVHFNHGLHPKSDDWEEHCRQFCLQIKVPLRVVKLSLQNKSGSSFELEARNARYQGITDLMRENDIYLTAHQANDQAETLFINLMRGSGSAGLAGIPALREFSNGWLARPLLNVSRDALESFLEANKVNWISDSSNFDQTMDRNYLRQSIFPLLEQRWPGLLVRLSQSAQHLRDQSEVIRDLLRERPELVSGDGITLRLEALKHVSPGLQAEIIRNWARENNTQAPPRARLEEFLLQLKDIRPESQAELRWSKWLIKHHSGILWLQESAQPLPCTNKSWDGAKRLKLSPDLGDLSLEGRKNVPLFKLLISCRAELPKSLERSKSVHGKIKEIMRLSGVPPWLRDNVPLVLEEQELVAVGDWWIAEEFRKKLTENDLALRWRPEHPLLQKIQSVGHNWMVDRKVTLV